jgi:hypothetical protein
MVSVTACKTSLAFGDALFFDLLRLTGDLRFNDLRLGGILLNIC